MKFLPKRALHLGDRATVVLDRKSGFPVRISHRREVRVAGDSTINTWTLVRQP